MKRLMKILPVITNLKRHLCGWRAMLAVSALLCVSGQAAARCQNLGSTQYFEFGTTIRVVANAAEVGETLGPWIYSSPKLMMNCGNIGSYTHWNYYKGSSEEGSTYQEDGKTYGVFATPIDGIGVIISVQPRSDRPAAYAVRRGAEIQVDIGEHVWVNQIIGMRLIKTGPTTAGRYDLSGHKLIDMRHEQRYSDPFSQEHFIFNSTFELVDIPLCHVASKTVNMPAAGLAVFATPGGYGPTRNFTVDLNCEVNAGRVKYYVEPVGETTSVDRARGIVDVQGGAKGVGLQLLDGTGNPIALGVSKYFGTSSADGPRSETFGARYIRTAANAGDVQVGQANATVRYRIDYP